jgi:hypothetical protein
MTRVYKSMMEDKPYQFIANKGAEISMQALQPFREPWKTR